MNIKNNTKRSLTNYKFFILVFVVLFGILNFIKLITQRKQHHLTQLYLLLDFKLVENGFQSFLIYTCKQSLQSIIQILIFNIQPWNDGFLLYEHNLVAHSMNFQKETKNLVEGFVSDQRAAWTYAADKYLRNVCQFFLVLQILKDTVEYLVHAFVRNVDLWFCLDNVLVFQENHQIINFAHFQEERKNMLENRRALDFWF